MKIRKIYLGLVTVALGTFVFFIAKLMQSEENVALKPSADPNLFSFVKPMQGAQPDGNIKMANDDALIVDAELRKMFEYYLATAGKMSAGEIKTKIEMELDKRLRPRAAVEAKRLLAQYLDYKRDMVNVDKNTNVNGTGSDAIRRRILAAQQDRLRFFTPQESQALFGLDDASDMDAVARFEIGQNKSLTKEQKREKIAAMDAAIPAAIRQERDTPQAAIKLEESVQKMRAQGATDKDIYYMRTAILTPDAAAHMAAMDSEKVAWQSRIASYLAERSKIMDANANLSDADRQAALQRKRDAGFSVDEQKRLAAYE